MKRSQSVFCFIICVMDYTYRQAEKLVSQSKRGPCLPLLCLSIIISTHGLQPWGPQRRIWSRWNISFSEWTIFFWFLLSLPEIHSKNCSPMGVIDPDMLCDSEALAWYLWGLISFSTRQECSSLFCLPHKAIRRIKEKMEEAFPCKWQSMMQM